MRCSIPEVEKLDVIGIAPKWDCTFELRGLLYLHNLYHLEPVLVEKAKPPKGGDAKLKGLKLKSQLRLPAAEASVILSKASFGPLASQQVTQTHR